MRLLKFQWSAFVECLFRQRARRNTLTVAFDFFAAHGCDGDVVVVVVVGTTTTAAAVAVAAAVRYFEYVSHKHMF